LSRDQSSNRGCCGQCQGGDGKDSKAHALGFVELRLNVAEAEPGYGYSDGSEADHGLEHGAAHDHTDNGAAVGAEGHADTDLRGAAGDGVGDDAVEAEACEQKSQDAEQSHEARDHAVLSEAVGDLLVEGLEFDDGEIGIDGGQRLAGGGLHVVHGAIGLDDDGLGVEAGVLLDRASARGLRYALGQGDEVHAVVLPGRATTIL
jgi:hypothetical protein